MNGIKNFRIKGNNKQVRQRIKDLCEQIVRIVSPQKIILFGSYAYGNPTADSDVDLLVIMPFEGHHVYQATKIRMQLQFPGRGRFVSQNAGVYRAPAGDGRLLYARRHCAGQGAL